VIYRCKTEHTSGSSFDSSKWELGGKYLFVVGTGTSEYDRNNAFTVKYDGSIEQGKYATASNSFSHAQGYST